LIILNILLMGQYIETNSGRVLLAISIVGTLAMLDRYLGIALIGTSMTAVLFLTRGSRVQRVIRSLLLALSAIPAGIWLLITSPLIDRRGPISFEENFNWFSKSILEWFFPASAVQSHLTLHILLLWVFIIGLIALSMVYSRLNQVSPFSLVVFIFGLFYVLALFGSASVAYYNKLGGRFLLPLFVPFITLLLVACAGMLKLLEKTGVTMTSRWVSIFLIGGLAIPAILLLQITFPLIVDSHLNGVAIGDNVYNTTAWRENGAIKYWLSHPPSGDYVLYSNNPDGSAFYTWHSCNSSPRRFSGPYGKIEFPLSGYSNELFSSGLDVYLIWIEPDKNSYMYTLGDLASIAQVNPLFASRDGGVYRLTPVK
jgi:hypothetical protein